ncbi:MAG: hypothetical protein SGI89_07835 [bacterium]|nr:hypothetical protein [bacterium]
MKIYSKLFIAVSFTILLSGFSANLYSQSLQFCEDVTSDGIPIKASSVFNISSKGGFLKCLTSLPYRVGTNSVSYDIYNIDYDGNEKYSNTIYQDVDASWTWFFKEITFYDEGRYNIYVYDADRNFLASSQIRIQYY